MKLKSVVRGVLLPHLSTGVVPSSVGRVVILAFQNAECVTSESPVLHLLPVKAPQKVSALP